MCISEMACLTGHLEAWVQVPVTSHPFAIIPLRITTAFVYLSKFNKQFRKAPLNLFNTNIWTQREHCPIFIKRLQCDTPH